MRFIVANYGARHAGLLLAHLRSIARTHAEAAVSVYWQDVPDKLLAALTRVAPRAEFIQTSYDFESDPLQRISSKVLCWARAAEEHAAEPQLVFCDSDTLVLRGLGDLFADAGWDITVTAKPERVPLNSGVMLARGGDATAAFFRAWRDRTVEILRSPDLFAQANDSSKPFGGTDQMSLYQMLGFREGASSYEVRCGDQSARVRVLPCAILNETNSRPLTAETRVVHYKGGWQRILLDGRPFSRFRPRAESWEMLGAFLEAFSDALAIANEGRATPLTAEDFGIRWPWYYQKGAFSRPAYAAWRIKEAAKRGWLLVTGRLKAGM